MKTLFLVVLIAGFSSTSSMAGLFGPSYEETAPKAWKDIDNLLTALVKGGWAKYTEAGGNSKLSELFNGVYDSDNKQCYSSDGSKDKTNECLELSPMEFDANKFWYSLEELERHKKLKTGGVTYYDCLELKKNKKADRDHANYCSQIQRSIKSYKDRLESFQKNVKLLPKAKAALAAALSDELTEQSIDELDSDGKKNFASGLSKECKQWLAETTKLESEMERFRQESLEWEPNEGNTKKSKELGEQFLKRGTKLNGMRQKYNCEA